ncbi:hypothetical protein H5395_01555 [Paracoccus sp. MC1854]|uniref:hypothetical protein n=1 Tax=Paracoccus sp. MC1854 TaxID=2760306 RepID=UPI0016034786|nr:hypothetical protein [Paracoccus sp. MC1854]MBB1490236.1 hypothetical protein [Paracoccus sp. MC1854]
MPHLPESSSNVLMIPCSAGQFGSFLASLLKTPRTIRRTFYQVVDVDVPEMVDVLQLVHQRIVEQHESSLASITIQVLFEDGRSVEISSIDEFASFSEPSNRKCVAVVVSSSYLVALPREQVPAKNEITIEFKADATSHVRKEIYGKRVISDFAPKESGIGYIIRHRSVSLGNDLANLLDAKIKSMEKVDRFAAFFSSGWVSLVCALVGAATGVLASIWLSSKVVGELALKGASLSGADAISAQIVAQSIASTILFLAMAAGLCWGFFLSLSLAKDRPSFIHLN